MFVVELNREVFNPESSGFRNGFWRFNLVTLNLHPSFREIGIKKPNPKTIQIAIDNQAQMWNTRFMQLVQSNMCTAYVPTGPQDPECTSFNFIDEHRLACCTTLG